MLQHVRVQHNSTGTCTRIGDIAHSGELQCREICRTVDYSLQYSVTVPVVYT